MTRYLFFAYSDCKDPDREDEYNEWYNTKHVPDMLEIPGMIQASRWVSAEERTGTQRKYLAMYELEADDIEEFDNKVREATMSTIERGRFSDLPVFEPPEVPRFYYQIMPAKTPKT
ncbi:MAG: hypothetical protein JW762_13130 [Dehalococcoidales bacterium]|nr:hypothetical protein [Dehalococcoidales bacterium]